MTKSFRLQGVNPKWEHLDGGPSLNGLTVGKFYTKSDDTGLDFIGDDDTLHVWDAFRWEGLEEQDPPQLLQKVMNVGKEPEVPGGTKYDDGKLMLGLLLADCHLSLSDVAGVLTFGARKYAPRGWRAVEPYRYLDAMFRHLYAYLRGEIIDEESGLPHLAHAACNLIFLMELDKEGKDMMARPVE